MDRSPRAALLAFALVGAAAASLVTLLWAGSFPAAAPSEPFDAVLAEGRGWSAVTLALGVPLGVWALVRRDSLRGRVVGAGVAAYLVYTYLELAVSPPFTPLYLAYVATFGVAVWALIAFSAGVDPAELAARIDPSAPRRGIVAYAAVIAFGPTASWLRGIVDQMVAGAWGYPVGAAAVGHVVHALDLGLQVPLAVAVAVLLARKEPAGWLAAAILLVQGTVMSAALVGMVGASLAAQGESVVGVAPFAGLCAVSAALLVALLRSIRDQPLRGVEASAADRFLQHRRIAFVGLSNDPKDFSRAVDRALVQHGVEVVPVNPHATEIDGRRCAARVQDLPDPPRAALLMVPADAAVAVIADCREAGVEAVWFHRGIGPGSASAEAVAAARDAGMLVVTDLCPLMVLAPVQGVHRAHRWLRGSAVAG